MTHARIDAGDFRDVERRADQAIAAARITGEHVWITLASFRCADPGAPGDLLLDRENLFTYPQIGCYVCEEPFTPRLKHRRCPGEPR